MKQKIEPKDSKFNPKTPTSCLGTLKAKMFPNDLRYFAKSENIIKFKVNNKCAKTLQNTCNTIEPFCDITLGVKTKKTMQV